MKRIEAEVNICSLYGDGGISLSFVTLKDKTKFRLGIGKLIQDQED